MSNEIAKEVLRNAIRHSSTTLSTIEIRELITEELVRLCRIKLETVITEDEVKE